MYQCGHVTMSGNTCKNSTACHLHSKTDSCSICLNSIRRTRGTRELPCGHLFHKVCINQWKNKQIDTTCPMCRKRFDTSKYKLSVRIENTDTEESQTFTGGSGDIYDMFERLDISELNTELQFNVESLDDLENILSELGFENNNIII